MNTYRIFILLGALSGLSHGVCLRNTAAFNWAPSASYIQRIKHVVRSFDTCMSNTGPSSSNPTNLQEIRLSHISKKILQFGRCSTSFEPYCEISNQLKRIFQLIQLLRSTPSLWENVLGGPMICSVSIICLFKNNMMHSMCMNQPALIPDTLEMFTLWLHRVFPLPLPKPIVPLPKPILPLPKPMLGEPGLCGPPSGIMEKLVPGQQICEQSLLAPQLPDYMLPPRPSPSYPVPQYYPEIGYGHVLAPPSLPSLINLPAGPSGSVICQAPDLCESSPTSNLLSPQINIQIQNCQPPCLPDHPRPIVLESDESKSSDPDESSSDESKSDRSDESDEQMIYRMDKLEMDKLEMDKLEMDKLDTSVESPSTPVVQQQNEPEAQTPQ